MGENKGVYSMSKKIAVILSGCGSFDGAEIGESVCSMLAIEKHQMTYKVFSLDEEQKQVVNALTGEKVDQKRNMMEEAARFTHGNISTIENIEIQSFDALWIPGGFGIVTSFSDLLEKKEQGHVHPKVLKLIKDFHKVGKPIVSICIAPTIVAKALEGKNVKMTLGESDAYYTLLEQSGHTPYKKKSEEYVFDEKSLIYSSPAFMDSEASYLKIFTACDNIAAHLSKLDITYGKDLT